MGVLKWLMFAFEESETRFSKKLVLLCGEIIFMKPKGFVTLYTLLLPRDTGRRSVTNSMHWHMSVSFVRKQCATWVVVY